MFWIGLLFVVLSDKRHFEVGFILVLVSRSVFLLP